MTRALSKVNISVSDHFGHVKLSCYVPGMLRTLFPLMFLYMDDQEDSDKGQEVGQGRTLALSLACARRFHATLSYKSVFLPNKLLGNFSFIIFAILHVKLWLHIKDLTRVR